MSETAFPFPFYETSNAPKCAYELDIIKISQSIREKPNWQTKCKDPDIVSRWKSELQEQEVSIDELDEILEYVLDELDYYGTLINNGIEVAFDGSYRSDTLISQDLLNDLIKGVAVLENIPNANKDWHPGSNEQVLDLVHPSLFCYVNGRSKVLKAPVTTFHERWNEDGQLVYGKDEDYLSQEEATQLARKHVGSFPEFAVSSKFQWLPCDIQVSDDGKDAKILSYINNLHPQKHANLYGCLEKIFAKFIPLFNKVLTSLQHPRPNRITSVNGDWYAPVPSDQEDNDEAWGFENRRFKEVNYIPTFTDPPQPSKTYNLNGKKVQVIVKLANIHLTPEKPKYPGGTWHVEGMGNERIVASGIYYYAMENVTESILKFRQSVDDPPYEQDDHGGVEKFFRLRNEEPLNQEIGSIVTKCGRCIAFPNIFQHKVEPFELQDPTKPGFRKILVFFLVDPTVYILSTAQVPPQQKTWFSGEVQSGPSPLPDLVIQNIVKFMDWPMSLEEAKKHREELMQERKYFIDESNEIVFEREFSLCEH